MQSMLSLRDMKVGGDLMSKDKKEKKRKKRMKKSHSIHYSCNPDYSFQCFVFEQIFLGSVYQL